MAVAMLQIAEMFTKEIYDQVRRRCSDTRTCGPRRRPKG
jgi:hypothetical protein